MAGNHGISSWSRMALAALALTGTAQAASTHQPRVIELTAKRFEFTPSEVRLTKGEPVTLRIASADATHGLYMKSLGIDAEIEHGKTTEVSFTPQVAGRFTAICDHFCGAGHGNMHMTFVVE
jgi:cytochrome c oxidase subunit II